MNFNLVTGYPLWFVLFCLMLGLIYALALYYRDRKHEFSRTLTRLMAIFRFITVSILSFFLLSPLLETISKSTENPIIVIGQDNSSSILHSDSLYYTTDYLEHFNQVIADLEQDYEVRLYRVGEQVFPLGTSVMDTSSITYNEKLSGLSAFFDEVNIIYANRNVGAVVLASDGIFNKGISPVYAAGKVPFPVYSIAMGDTSVQRDLILKRLNYNRIAFKGNYFPIEVYVNANKCNSKKVLLSVYHRGKIVERKELRVNSDRYTKTVLLNIEALETGLQRYRVVLAPLDDEINTRNNLMDAYIDVMDARQKVLILSNSPHPDITAIKQALGDNYNYEVEDYLTGKFDGAIDAYNLVILHQLPSISLASAKLIRDLEQSSVPVLYIIGLQTDLAAFNNLKTGLSINYTDRYRLNETQADFNEAFVLFKLSKSALSTLSSFPPLKTCFGDYSMIRNTDVLFFQRIGLVTTTLPLIMINKSLDKKIGVITGDGIWKWRITNYMKKGNHDAFNEIIDKLVQYLSIQEDKRLFRVKASQTFYENESVVMDAALYNESYELINDPDVKLTISSEEGNQYNYSFNKYGDAYTLNAGGFPVGDYQYTASVKLGMQSFTDAGGFSILPLEIESVSTIADHNLLYRIATENDGKMLTPAELNSLPELIRERGDVKPVIYTQKRFTDLVNLPWIFVLLIVLLGAEWFLRKWGGSY